MIEVHSFVFNAFQENTYILWDETKEAIIIDPGCYSREEQEILETFISDKKLKPVKLLNTHAHLDHILGNNFVSSRYQLALEMNELDVPLLKAGQIYGELWGIRPEPSPEPAVLLRDGDSVNFGNSKLEVLFTPGHSAGSISFYSKPDKLAISGDVLFQGSIGRTDLPGGDFETLISSIRQKLFPLENQTRIFSGHGPATTIGFEKENNPFLSS